MIYVCLADGFEELEALAPVDILRRAGIPVQMLGVGGRRVTGAHGIPVEADAVAEEASPDTMTGLVLPGGVPGTPHLEASAAVQRLLEEAVRRELLIGAICAAPSILGHKGLLRGRRATCFPGYEPELTGAEVCGELVVRDGRFITGKGAGAAVAFALQLVEYLTSPEQAEAIRAAMQCGNPA